MDAFLAALAAKGVTYDDKGTQDGTRVVFFALLGVPMHAVQRETPLESLPVIQLV